MRNVALLEMGARLSQASSHHSDYPASGIIDKYAKTQKGSIWFGFRIFLVKNIFRQINVILIALRCFHEKKFDSCDDV